MKNQCLLHTFHKLVLSLLIVSISLLAGCSDDPQSTNEEEVITTIIVTLTPEDEGNAVVTLSWDDANSDAIVDAIEVIISGPLRSGEAYEASIQILNKSAEPEIDISEEIAEEAEEHIFCFTVTTVGISITNLDEDTHGLPLGLTSTWATAASASTGTVNIVLRHQPGVKTGDCPGAGDTDVDITFLVSVETEEEARSL